MRRWLVSAPKGRHRQPEQITVRSVVLYALLAALFGASIALAGFGYYVALREGFS